MSQMIHPDTLEARKAGAQHLPSLMHYVCGAVPCVHDYGQGYLQWTIRGILVMTDVSGAHTVVLVGSRILKYARAYP